MFSLRWLAGMGILLCVLTGCNLNNAPAGQGNAAITGAPVVQIASPLPNATFLEGVNVNIQAAVTNAGADIERVDVSVDDTVLISIPQPNTAGLPVFSVTQAWRAEGTGVHTVSVTAFRADGSSSAPASVSVTVVNQEPQSQATPSATTGGQGNTAGGGNSSAGGGQATAGAPTNTPAPTNTEAPAATATSSRPIATFNTGVNVRRGPGTVFAPPIGSFAAQATADILGRNPAGDWYKIRYYNGEGWVAASLIVVSGDISTLPVDPGPATPTFTPPPPTAPPVTVTPPPAASAANLVITSVTFAPDPPVCNTTFNITVRVTNNGTAATTASGSINVVDTHLGSNSTAGSTQGGFPVLQPGQTFDGVIPLTVAVYYNEAHRVSISLDPANSVPEANEGDNATTKDYTLQKGSCP